VARILIGIMGDALGHINQALTIAGEMPEHTFLFVGGGNVLDLTKRGYRVESVPVPATYYKNNRVDVSATVRNAIRVLSARRQIVNRLVQLILAYKPDLILTSYEYFTPLAAKKTGIPCISVDKQHAVTKCDREGIRGEPYLSRIFFEIPLRFMYSKSDYYLINTFFRLHPKNPRTTLVFPPLLSPLVRNFVPAAGEHILVYQTSPTFENLLRVLAAHGDKCIIYGTGRTENSGNLIFKEPSREGFLQDLASCRYCITNGGHNVISEALYFGKPVFSFPIRLAYEQYLNAYMLADSGYGAYNTGSRPSLDMFRHFEKHLDRFRQRISGGNFMGNEKIVNWLNTFLQNNLS